MGTNGYPVKFWTAEIRSATNGGGKPVYTATEVLGFLNTLQGYAYSDPFQFTPGDELREDLAILKQRPKDSLTELLQEILAFELNDAAGLGIIGNDGLQDALITYSESVYINNTLAPAKGEFTPTGTITTDDTDVDPTKELLQPLF